MFWIVVRLDTKKKGIGSRDGEGIVIRLGIGRPECAEDCNPLVNPVSIVTLEATIPQPSPSRDSSTRHNSH